ncbi:hypothetical protein [Massilia frigida]|uniref:hypothetical protein n=1 Tax=Massilia frigida TaxID=2609281 RepID=UPI0014226775|nr:hypothetical protein [Massilia frigida]
MKNIALRVIGLSLIPVIFAGCASERPAEKNILIQQLLGLRFDAKWLENLYIKL